MTRTEIKELVGRKLREIEQGLPKIASGCGDAAELRAKLEGSVEAREVIHLRGEGAPFVTDRLEEILSQKSEFRDALICCYTYLVEKSDFRGALPILIAGLESGFEPSSLAPHFLTQSIKALSRQDGQRIMKGIFFSELERAETIGLARSYVPRRVRQLIDSLTQPELRVGTGASDPHSLRVVIERSPEVIELIYLDQWSLNPILKVFGQDLAELMNRDHALCCLAYVTEQSGETKSVAALIAFLEKHRDNFMFSPDFVARALQRLTRQEKPNRVGASLEATEIDLIVENARRYLRGMKEKN